jgi:outer membrane protein assembly factor BamD (BamD/ComL family)
MGSPSVPSRRCGARIIHLAFILALILSGRGVSAIEEAQVDFAVLAELNRLEFYDYAELLVEQMESRYPDRLDEVLVEKARTCYTAGKSKQADATIERIKPTSPSFPQALVLKAEVSALRGRNEDAAAAYAQYFQNAKAPPPDNRRALAAYTRAVSFYSTVLKRLGKGAEAAKVLELLGKTAGASDRKLTFLKAQALIDTEESKFNDKAPVDHAAVQEALKQLQELLFLRDGVAVSAYLETARAYLLLGGDELNTLKQQNKAKEALTVTGFRQALDTIRMADEADLFRDIEKEMAKGNDSSSSPYAGALYYKAEACRGLALAQYMAGDEAKAHKLAKAAAKLLETVISEYGESEYRSKALAKHEKCSAFLEQAFGDKTAISEASADAEMSITLEQAQALLLNKDYRGATPLYLEALRLGRRSKRLPEIATRLILCLGSTDRLLEAQAVGSYLAQVMPKIEGTADCLYRLGGVMFEKAKTLEGSARADMLASAMDAWELFVEAAPDHPKAAEVCFAIAEHDYRLANDAAELSRKAPATEKERLKAQAHEAFLAAAPKYQRLIERYSSIDKGVRALYKLGWIYYTVQQPRESIDAFLRYCDAETLPAFADDRLEAKFRAAEQLMLGDAPAEAVEQYGELLSWLEPGNDKGFDPTTKTALRLKEDGTSYLAWAADLAGEKSRPEITAIRERLSEIGRQQRRAEDDIRAARDLVQSLGTDTERLRQEYADTAQAIATVELDFAKLAQAEAAKRPGTEVDLVKMAADMEARARTRVSGDSAARQAERDILVNEKMTQVQQAAETQARVTAATKTQAAAATVAQTALERLRVLREAAAVVEKAIVEGEAASRAQEDQLQQLQQQRETTEDAAAREALEKKARAMSELIAQTRAKTTEAYKRREQTASPEAEKQMAEAAAAVTKAQDAARLADEDLATAQQREKLAAVDSQIVEARTVAVAKALDAATALEKALAQADVTARLTAEPDLKAGAQQAVAAFTQVRDLQLQRASLVEAAATGRIKTAEARLLEFAAATTDLNEKLKPLQAALEDAKRQALTAFETFLTAYPKSAHVPKNLSRLGAIYLELQQYDKAAATLNRLATEFPDSEATQEALFSLGRAQCEQGDNARAAETFGKVLQKPAALSPANLTFVSERLLEKGAPAVSLAASRELIARSEQGKDGESEKLRVKAREPSLFRAGQACLQLKRYDEALKFLSTLIAESPRTGYFFDACFGLAEARRNLTPPDLNGAMADLGQIIQFSEDPVQSNRALCLVGEALAAGPDERGVQQAVARFQQVILLADPRIEANLPWLEMAMVESAKALARLGQTKERDEMVALYRNRFPQGKRLAELESLPAAPTQVLQPSSQPPAKP